MTMFDYVWLCMTMYDYEWLCMTMYDFVWICMTLYESVWLCMTMNDYVQLCMTMYDNNKILKQFTGFSKKLNWKCWNIKRYFDLLTKYWLCIKLRNSCSIRACFSCGATLQTPLSVCVSEGGNKSYSKSKVFCFESSNSGFYLKRGLKDKQIFFFDCNYWKIKSITFPLVVNIYG